MALVDEGVGEKEATAARGGGGEVSLRLCNCIGPVFRKL